MALISLQEVSLGFGGPLLLEEINLQIERGEWVGLLGRNGMGKSTLLKLVNGDLSPAERRGGAPAESARGLSAAGDPAGIGRHGGRDRAGRADGGRPIRDARQEHAWQGQLQVEQVISRMSLEPAARFDSLSAGLKRRVLLARGLVRAPDLLLLDEPTNHLDIHRSTGWKPS